MCDELAKAKINIYALSISDTVDHAVVRMVVNNTPGALQIFEDHNTLVVENEVLMIENDNKPGTLGGIAAKLSKAKINIEYAYLATSPGSRKGLCILRLNDTRKALDLLTAR